jgi:hypothetical protein
MKTSGIIGLKGSNQQGTTKYNQPRHSKRGVCIAHVASGLQSTLLLIRPYPI